MSNAEIGCTADQMMQSIFPLIRDGLIIQNSHAAITAVNPAAERLLGLAAADLIGQPLTAIAKAGKLIHEDGSEFPRELLSTLDTSRTGTPLRDVVLGIYRPDGMLIWLALDAQPLVSNGASAPYAVATILRDATERKQMELAVAAREQEFRSLAESSLDSIIRYDLDGRIRYLNCGLLNYFGLSASDVIGKLPGEVWPDGRYAEIDRAIALALKTGKPMTVEFGGAGAAGKLIFSQVHVIPERDVAGQIIGAIGYGRDVTAIREAERKLKHFIDNLPGLAYTYRISPDGHDCFPYVSPAIEEYYGLKPVDVQNETTQLHMLAHPDDRPRIEAAIAESARTMTPFRVEMRVCRPGLSVRWLDVRSMPEREVDGSIVWHGIMLDITERKGIEAQLRLKEFALDQAHEAAYLIDEGGEGFLYVNEAACRSLGYSREELLSLTLADIDPYLSPEDARIPDKLSAAGGAYRLESRHRRRDGSSFPIEVNVSNFEYQGRMLGLALVRDISERKATEAALRSSEERMRLFFERQLVGMAITSPEKGWIQVNDKICEMLGYTREELARLTWVELTHPDDLAADTAQFERMLGGEIDSYTLEKRFVRKDGGIVFTDLAVGCVRRTDHSVDYVLAMLKDISERKRAEALLMKREREFRTFAENMPDNIVRYNREGVTVYVNPALERTLGDLAAAMIGKTTREYLPDGSYEDYARLLDAVLANGEAGEMEKILHEPDGETREHQIRMVPERDENGEVVGVLAIGRDITEYKRSEEALRASEEKFRTLAENMPFILVRYDREGCRTYVNPSAERSFGFLGEQVIGKTLPEINPLRIQTVEAYQRALKHTLTTGERSEFEMQVSLASGDVRIGNTVIVAERTVDGEICGAITIGRDITQLKQAEQQLRELTVHLQTVREEEKSHLAREIHDDLGSTLAALKLKLSHFMDFELAEEMKSTPLFARLESMSFIIENAIAATRRIITDMRPDVLDNLGLFDALKWQAEQFHLHTGIMCQIVCANDLGCVDCRECAYQLDKAQTINIFRIFQESLTNVARHSGASKVEAEYQPGNGEVLLVVSDNGCGLPEGHSAASTSFGIRGMRERVGQLGGDIRFDTPPGGGLRVVVRVPLATSDVK